MVKASASSAEDPGFKSHLRRDCSWSSHISDIKIGSLVVSLPGAWSHRVSAGLVGQVSVYCDWVKVESLICNFYLSVVARKMI